MGGIGEFPANQFGTGTRMMPLNMWGGDRRQDPNVPISGPWPLKRALREAASGNWGDRNRATSFFLLRIGGLGSRWLENPKGEWQMGLTQEMYQGRAGGRAPRPRPASSLGSTRLQPPWLLSLAQLLFSGSVQTLWGNSDLGGAEGRKGV